MRNIRAVFFKQIIDTVKNITVLIQFLMLPILTIIMENAVKIENMPDHFFVKLFASMFIGMAPLMCMSAVISEEKEKNTLRALMMSNVSPAQYLVGVGAYVFIMCTGGTAVFAILGEYSGGGLAVFLFAMVSGILISELIGAAIGIFGKNQTAAISVSVPVMMIFAFLPMISLFNKNVEEIAKVTYSQQISRLINGMGVSGITAENIIVIALNFVVSIALFFIAYKKKGLENLSA